MALLIVEPLKTVFDNDQGLSYSKLIILDGLDGNPGHFSYAKGL